MKDSQLYLNIYICGLPFVFFYNVATGIFSALGDSKTPFFFLMASSLSQHRGGYPVRHGVRHGRGRRCVGRRSLCQGVSCVLALVFAFRSSGEDPPAGGPEGSGLLRHMTASAAWRASPSRVSCSRASSPVPAISCCRVSSIRIGTAVMAGYSASVKLNNLVITSLVTLGNGISNFTAQNLGAQKAGPHPQRLPRGSVSCVGAVRPADGAVFLCGRAAREDLRR